MNKRFRVALFALLAVLGLTLAIGTSGAQAVTWTNLGTVQDTTYFDSCDGDTGNVQMKMQWEVSSDYKLRLSAAYDIVIVNNSNGRIGVDSWSTTNGDFGHLTYERAYSPYLISAYQYGSAGTTIYIPAHSSKTFSADAADRWTRLDGVADSDPSPSNTYISSGSDPRISLITSMQLYHNGTWSACGSSNNLILEVLNNAA
jgi:ABC-type glycerol-3-phosphate transport system substrate-binding protein